MTENIIYEWFKSGGKCLILRNGKIVHHNDFFDKYWELEALGLSFARILQFLSKDPTEEERQIIKNARLNRNGDNND